MGIYLFVKIGICFDGLWCNGNTTDFGSVISGSSPDSLTPIDVIFKCVTITTWSVKIV